MGIEHVPVVECAVDADYAMRARPPLLDLAWLNLAHWQSSSDQRHILHIARVPILFARGMDTAESQIDIGPNRIIMQKTARRILNLLNIRVLLLPPAAKIYWI